MRRTSATAPLLPRPAFATRINTRLSLAGECWFFTVNLWTGDASC